MSASAEGEGGPAMSSDGGGQTTPPTVDGVQEATLFVSDLARSAAFYRRALGLDALHETPDGAVFRVGAEQVLLLVTAQKARVQSETPGGTIPACRTGAGAVLGAGHVAFSAAEADVAAWRAKLEREDVPLVGEVEWEGGGRSLYFRDPDGHLLELATTDMWDGAEDDR